MSIQVMGDVWKYSEAAGNDLLLLLAMADHSNDRGICWPSIAQLADKTRVSESTVKRSIKALIKLGELKIDEAGGTFFFKDTTKRLANRYQVLRGKRLYRGENPEQAGGGQNEPGTGGQNEPGVHSPEPGAGSIAVNPARGAQLSTGKRHEEPPKRNVTTKGVTAQAKNIITSEMPVVVVSSGEAEEETDNEQTVEDLAVEFAASKKQTQALAGYVTKRGPSAAAALAAYARPFPNRVQRFWAGVRDDYTPAEKAVAPEPKAKAVEPAGWQEAYRRMSRNRYGIENPEVYAYWKNVPPSVRLDVLAELERPTTEGNPAGQPAVVDFKQARAAVQNAGKTSKQKA